MPFVIKHHVADAIVEVVYPERPSPADVARYVREARASIDSMTAPWCCLVDQRALAILPPELAVDVATLNGYAQGRGMKRMARVVASAASAMQIARIARVAVGVPVRVFQDREAAVRWLKKS